MTGAIGPASPLDRILGAVIDGAGAVAAVCGFALVLVVGGNVLLRYVLGTGSVGFQELEWHLISPIALLGMSYGMRHGAHVRVDVLYDRLGPAVQAAIDTVAAILMGAMAVAMILLSLPYVQQSFGMMEGSPDPGGLPWRFALKAFIPLGFAILVLQALAQAMMSARQCRAALAAAALAGGRP